MDIVYRELLGLPIIQNVSWTELLRGNVLLMLDQSATNFYVQ